IHLMDRLSVVRVGGGASAARAARRSVALASVAAVGCMIVLSACDDPPAKDAPEGEARVNAVMASSKKQSFADLCDLAPEGASKPFVWPELADPAPPLAAGARYRWVNVWATWCKPCIEELPLLTKTFADWKKAGQAVDLTLVSVD